MVPFATPVCDCDSHSPAPLDLYLFSDASICSTIVFPPFGNSYHVILVSIDLPANSKGYAPSHHSAYDNSRADWDGLLFI